MMQTGEKKRLIVGISGASGVVMGYWLLRALKQAEGVETHLILTEGARKTLALETDLSPEEIYALADFHYSNEDLAARISSGSYQTEGMIILPCSMKTLSGIVHGYDENLLVRAADVCLKENRRVVLAPREMPFNRIHLRNLLTAAELGIVIVPPLLTFYNKPEGLKDQINHVIGKIMAQFALNHREFVPWQGEQR